MLRRLPEVLCVVGDNRLRTPVDGDIKHHVIVGIERRRPLPDHNLQRLGNRFQHLYLLATDERLNFSADVSQIGP